MTLLDTGPLVVQHDGRPHLLRTRTSPRRHGDGPAVSNLDVTWHACVTCWGYAGTSWAGDVAIVRHAGQSPDDAAGTVSPIRRTASAEQETPA